ncbi:MAG: hypothetical protein AB1629_00425 [Candidatus Omnitrophota bacterium]
MKNLFFRNFYTTKAVAMVTVLIFIIVVSMVAVTSIFLMTNQARLIERQVRRIIGFYSSQAAIVQANDELFNNPAAPITPNLTINGQDVTITHDSFSGQLDVTTDLSF